MKDAQLRLRVERDLREDFGRTCRMRGSNTAEVLRAFMRDYVDREFEGRQQSLLDPTPPERRGSQDKRNG